ncbi:MAG: DNA topoisomerase IV subunit A, partial [Magnetococcus sp. WYHC-3]
RLLERIAHLIVQQKSPLLEDVRDESDERLRIVIEPKSSRLDPEVIMAYLFKNTDLETRFTVNLNVITAGTRPEVLDLKGLLRAWLDHRFVVHTRRARHELRRIEERLHLLAALLVAHLNIDEVIAIIKEHDSPAPVLMQRFGLDALQAEAILNMRLRHLRRLEEMEIRKEMEEKHARAAELAAMLADSRLMWKAIRRELKETRKSFADPRRTELSGAPVEVPAFTEETLVVREPLSVLLSEKGWVRSVKGHGVDRDTLRFKEGDALQRVVEAYSTDAVSFLSRQGKVYTVFAHRLPGGKGFGEPLTMVFELEGGDTIAWVLAVDAQQEYFVATMQGQGFRIAGADLMANMRTGRQVVTLGEGDAPLHVLPVRGPLLAAIGRSRRMLVCAVDEFPLLSRGKGVRIQKLGVGELQVDVVTFDPAQGITLNSGKRERQILDVEPWRGKRAARGAILPHGFLGGAVFQGTGASLLAAGRGLTRDLFENT